MTMPHTAIGMGLAITRRGSMSCRGHADADIAIEQQRERYGADGEDEDREDEADTTMPSTINAPRAMRGGEYLADESGHRHSGCAGPMVIA